MDFLNFLDKMQIRDKTIKKISFKNPKVLERMFKKIKRLPYHLKKERVIFIKYLINCFL